MSIKTKSNLIQINQIFNDDSRKIKKVLGKNIKVTTTITSPPYFDMKDYGSENQIGFGQTYEEYLKDLKNIFTDIHEITVDQGSLWIIVDSFKRENQVVTLPFDLSNKLKEIGWLLQDIIIWKKDKTVPWSQNGFVQRKFEYILFFTKSTKFIYNKDQVRNFDTTQLKKWWVKYPERYNPKGKALDEIWEYPIPVQGSWGEKYIRHFCPLPKEMVAKIIELSSNEEDIVLDPFAGSGTVPFQSFIMNRKYIGFEVNHDYIKMFNNYMIENSELGKNEYINQQNLGNQEEFRKTILNLRALKFGRLLVNELEKFLSINFKIHVEITEYLEEKINLIKVNYTFVDLAIDLDYLKTVIKPIIIKPPFSKFGIVSEYDAKEISELNSPFYCYTKTNSYSYSKLPINSTQIKVVSPILVDLNENDYS